MGTEEFWKQEKKKVDINSENIHPVIKQTMEDNKSIHSLKNSKVLYTECLKGALFWNQWAQSDDLSLQDMGMMICRDIGCELTYCQASIYDPYERPFENCDEQFKNLNSCIAQEQRRYLINPEGRSMQEQIQFMLEKKKKEKYINILQTHELHLEKENIVKQSESDRTILKNKL